MTTRNIVCRNCNTTNRVPTARLEDHPKCGRCKQPMFQGHPIELNEQNFQKMVSTNDLPVLVDFWAPWCGPCRQMAPAFSQAAERLEPTMLLAKLDTDRFPQLATPYQITGIPTLILFHRGREIGRTSGALSAEQIVHWVQQAAAQVMAS